MRVYYFNFRRLIRWTIIAFIIAVGLHVAHTMILQSSVPTMNQFDPIYQGSEDEKQVALICNVVWGEEYLPNMLEILEKQETKMTFFIGGQWAEKFPDLVQEIDKKGHEIGNHGYAHLHPTKISLSKNVKEIKKTEEILYKISGKKTPLFHPPYREINNDVAKKVGQEGYKTIMSSVDTIDWQRPPASVIVERVISKVHNGAIVLMHPTEPTKDALGEMIKQLKEEGYTIVTVSELLSEKKHPEAKFNDDVGQGKED